MLVTFHFLIVALVSPKYFWHMSHMKIQNVVRLLIEIHLRFKYLLMTHTPVYNRPYKLFMDKDIKLIKHLLCRPLQGNTELLHKKLLLYWLPCQNCEIFYRLMLERQIEGIWIWYPEDTVLFSDENFSYIFLLTIYSPEKENHYIVGRVIYPRYFVIFSSPDQRPCELLPSLVRPSYVVNFHI